MEQKPANEPEDDGSDLLQTKYQRLNEIEPIPKKKIDEGYGYCPIPSQKVLNQYIGSFVQLAGNATGILHTNDRVNMKAYYEKLVDKNFNPEPKIQNETWAEVVET